MTDHIKKTIEIHLVPGANFDKINQIENHKFKIYTTAIAEKNKANKSLVKMLAKFFHLPQKSVVIKSGHTSRNKIIEITIPANSKK